MKESDLPGMARRIKRFAQQEGKNPAVWVQQFHQQFPDATTTEAFHYFSTGNSPQANSQQATYEQNYGKKAESGRGRKVRPRGRRR